MSVPQRRAASALPCGRAGDAIDLSVLQGVCDEALGWPNPGGGDTGWRFDRLAAVARRDLVLGRLVEAHADAVAITSELGSVLPRPAERWGVWAAGPVERVEATVTSGQWRLSGVKAWCSGATLLTHALVDATAPDGVRLFAVELGRLGVEPLGSDWAGTGMARADTRSVAFDGAAAVPVGEPGAYLTRPGFWAGAVGVAACWHGGTVAVASVLLDAARSSEDPHLLAHLGAVHVALEEDRAVIDQAARCVDAEPAGDHRASARSARTTVERNASKVIDRVGRALGPEPLARRVGHQQLVTDLMTYVRQHRGERDLEQIGRDVASIGDPWDRR